MGIERVKHKVYRKSWTYFIFVDMTYETTNLDQQNWVNELAQAPKQINSVSEIDI